MNGHILRTASVMVLETSVAFLRLRLRFGLLLSRMWLLYGFMRLILPVPVVLKRFAAARRVFNFGIIMSSCYFLLTAMTMVMFLPSILGSFSTWAVSFNSSANRTSKSRPSSGWLISRPRNMIVTFTLLPSPRKRCAAFILT